MHLIINFILNYKIYKMKRVLSLVMILTAILVSCGKENISGSGQSSVGGAYVVKATVTEGILTEAEIQIDMHSDDSQKIQIPEAEIYGKTEWSREYSFKRTTYVSVWAETYSDNSTLVLELFKDGKLIKRDTKVGKGDHIVAGVSVL